MGRMVEQNRSGSYTQIVYGPDGSKLALMNGQTLSKAFVPLAREPFRRAFQAQRSKALCRWSASLSGERPARCSPRA